MAATLTLGDEALIRLRLRALGLDAARRADAGGDGSDGAARVRGVVSHLFALQGQDWRSSKWAVGVRAPGVTPSDVTAALSSGRVVRSWPMRGTVHLVAAEDIGWMQQLTNPRVLAGAPKRRAFLGMSDAVLERATEVSLAALAGGNSLDREQLASVWTEAGIEWQPSWRYHLIWWLCQNGLATFGPVPAVAGGAADPEPRLVLASEWIAAPRSLSGDDALVEFASRYVAGRGAVTKQDLAAWSNLPAAAAGRALALAAASGSLVEARRADVAGAAGALWVDPAALAALDTTGRAEPAGAAPGKATGSGWQLLPAFDEHLLGFAGRAPQFDNAHLGLLVPGRNGVFLATVVHEGRVVGTWRRDPKSRAVTAAAFPGERIDGPALAVELARWAEFSGTPTPELVLA